MFIISKNKNARNILQNYKEAFCDLSLKFGSIYEFTLINDFTLVWFSAKPQDQLYKYKNGFIIGKKKFEDSYSDQPKLIDSDLPECTHPLLQNTIIKILKDEILVKPNEVTSIFYDDKFSVSDYSILLAKLDGKMPQNTLVQLLTAVGYFPGNLTLFKDIVKIPYLKGLQLNHRSSIYSISDFVWKKADDDAMVQRLQEVVPHSIKQSLAMSGGLDSRFVLGVLLKENINPTLRSLEDKENEIVDELNKDLKLEYHKTKYPKETAYHYTLMTDARIYFRGGNYSSMFDRVHKDEIIHTGLSILPMNENSFASAWKKPGSIKTIYNDLITYALLPRMPRSGFTIFKDIIQKDGMQRFLEKELSFGKGYVNFKTRKQWALWFYHLNRGLTWTFAHVLDLSFYIYPVFILGDKKAAELGITSSAYSNFNKERLRRINQKLFPNMNLDYSDGRSFKSKPFFNDHFTRIYNEYFKKLISRFKHLKVNSKRTKANWFDDLETKQAKKFESYYHKQYLEIIQDKNENLRVKRVAVTLNNLLLFLEK